MKKLLLGLSMLAVTLISAQNYPDSYPNYGGGNNNQNHGYYGDEEDSYYFPDDYYYQYPSDYYTNSYYESCYNDYVRSINAVNWNRFFSTYRLAPWQIREIIYLNQMFPSFSAWDQYYRYNPDRWYYDRFYALERILGPRIFVVFQNRYYGGYSPVVYYQNYRARHYARNIYVVPRYRKININVYRVDRDRYHADKPKQNWGSINGTKNGNSPRIGDAPRTGNQNGGFRNDTNPGQNGGFRNIPGMEPRTESGTKSGGFRNDSGTGGFRLNEGSQPRGEQRTGSGSFRNDVETKESSIRNTAPEKRIEKSPNLRSNDGAGFRTPQNSGGNSGMRFTSR
ncbi:MULTISPECIES: hypothetical protein [Chryseobacterium]|uniref:hypothetical protein n=1 Tax=Chryseobacterium sp. R2A-55 TaxID=2744445 RepID=UPI001F270F1F|nr:hypothetical protein [Chryseobacterium sp. R2A-55]